MHYNETEINILNFIIHFPSVLDFYTLFYCLFFCLLKQQLSYCNEHLAVPAIKWIGIYPSDINKFGIQTISFKYRDNIKLRTLIDRPFITNQVYQELMILKHMQRKSEIEGMADSSCAYLIDVYLKHKLANEINV